MGSRVVCIDGKGDDSWIEEDIEKDPPIISANVETEQRSWVSEVL